MPDHPLEQRVLGPALEALKTALGERLLAVVLFGSRARGEASAGSDWDLLVLAEGLPAKPFDRHLFLKRQLPPDCRGAVSLLAKTPQEFEASLPPLYLAIALDGQILYDPRTYVAQRLAALRHSMEEAGLHRQRTRAGEVWRWERAPANSQMLGWER
jgi:predicted nucleotidyltransferase